MPPDQSVATFLHKRLTQALNDREWAAADRTLTVSELLRVNGLINTVESSAVRTFLAGLNYEETAQVELAARSFQIALRSGARMMPLAEVRVRLRALKGKDPAAFERGTAAALAGPLDGSTSSTSEKSPAGK